MTYEGQCLLDVIEILYDLTVDTGTRDDIAMDLGNVKAEELEIAIDALCRVGANTEDDKMVLNSCGESIGDLWVKRGSIDIEKYQQLSEVARWGVQQSLSWRKPDWLPLLQEQ